jgi:hypothetical protein
MSGLFFHSLKEKEVARSSKSQGFVEVLRTPESVRDLQRNAHRVRVCIHAGVLITKSWFICRWGLRSPQSAAGQLESRRAAVRGPVRVQVQGQKMGVQLESILPHLLGKPSASALHFYESMDSNAYKWPHRQTRVTFDQVIGAL